MSQLTCPPTCVLLQNIYNIHSYEIIGSFSKLEVIACASYHSVTAAGR